MYTRTAALLFTCLATATSALPQLQKRGPSFLPSIYKCENPNQIALTFDDGPYIYNADIAKILSDAGARGTFFLNGNNWACINDPQLAGYVKSAYNMGHQIASHTWSHKYLTTLNDDQLNSEMYSVEAAVHDLIGVVPAMMRPPYGDTNDHVAQVASARGQAVVTWDFDSGDSTGASAEQTKRTYDDLIARHPSNALALNHETYQTTAQEVLSYIVPRLQGAGYQLVTVAECTGRPAYQPSISGPAATRMTC